jgi:uncharacterized protein YndB with AHSA1/START domain
VAAHVTGEEAPIRLERLLSAPVEEVFDAMTDPARMVDWFSPIGRAEVEADPVVGGRLHVVMVEGDVRIEHDGEFLDVRRPSRLAFTWRSRYTGARTTVVTVELSDEDGKTRLVLEHDQLPVDARASHEGGWGAILDRLATIVATSREGS